MVRLQTPGLGEVYGIPVAEDLILTVAHGVNTETLYNGSVVDILYRSGTEDLALVRTPIRLPSPIPVTFATSLITLPDTGLYQRGDSGRGMTTDGVLSHILRGADLTEHTIVFMPITNDIYQRIKEEVGT